MARKRMIDPEFWTDEEIGGWSITARLFYIGLWSHSDDAGRLKAHPNLLKSAVFPYNKRINVARLKLEVSAKVQWYTVGGAQYGHLMNFLKHQRIDRPTDSKLPSPSNSTKARRKLDPNISKDKLREVKLSKDKVSLFDEIISDLNLILKTSYKKDLPKTKELISARLKDGFVLDDFKIVHRKMAKAWGTDNKMRQYLRPQTLYSNKFEGYLNRPDDLKVSAAGAKTYQAGQEWLKNKKEKENAK